METKEQYIDIDELIVSYLSGSLSEEDLARLQRWALESEEHRDYVRNSLEIGFSAGVAGNHEDVNADKAFAAFLQRAGLQQPRQRRIVFSWKNAYRAAAVVALVLMTGIGYYQGKHAVTGHFADIVLEAPMGTQTALSVMPPLPGNAKSSVISGFSRSFLMMACSRPPPPTTNTFIDRYLRMVIEWGSIGCHNDPAWKFLSGRCTFF